MFSHLTFLFFFLIWYLCYLLATIISITSVHILMQIQRRTLCCSDKNGFINYFSFVLRHEERDNSWKSFVSYYANYTMVGTQLLHTIVRTQLLNTMVGTQLLHTIMIGPLLQLSPSVLENPTVCLHRPKSTPKCHVFQNPQILKTIASEHEVIRTPAPFPYL